MNISVKVKYKLFITDAKINIIINNNINKTQQKGKRVNGMKAMTVTRNKMLIGT